MTEWLIKFFGDYPEYTYLAVGLIFVLSGVGLPAPEEIVLVIAGWLCHTGRADLGLMMLACATAILVGDLTPYSLGRLFGPRILRLRWMRWIVNKERLATFDVWFRRRGAGVILIARFIPGLRVVAFFTAGTMRMTWGRFLFLDLCGIAITCPLFIWLGFHFGAQIDSAIAWVKSVEDSILYSALIGGAAFGAWYWMRRRDRRRRLVEGPRETFVEPRKAPSKQRAEGDESRQVTASPKEASSAGHSPDAAAPEAGEAPPEVSPQSPEAAPPPTGARHPNADS